MRCTAGKHNNVDLVPDDDWQSSTRFLAGPGVRRRGGGCRRGPGRAVGLGAVSSLVPGLAVPGLAVLVMAVLVMVLLVFALVLRRTRL